MNKLVMFARRGTLLVLALLIQAEAAAVNKNIVVSGRLICLAPDLKESPCEASVAATLAIKAADGTLYRLTAGKSADTLLQEKRLKTREFRLILRETDEGEAFQIIKSQLIRDGKVLDFFYFCEICNITTYTPGPCMCCRAPTEYREGEAQK